MAGPSKHAAGSGRPDEGDLLRRFRDYLADAGLKYTQPREDILLAFFASEGHVSAEDLFQTVRDRNSAIGFATVHRTLKLLVDAGFAEEHRFGGRLRRYEPALKREHHDHLICGDCGFITEFEEPQIEALQDAVAARFGFQVTDHRLELFGACLAKRRGEECPHEEARRKAREG